MDKRVILHIGYPKAGSTLLQKHILGKLVNSRCFGQADASKNLELICELSKDRPDENIIKRNLAYKIQDPNSPVIISHEHFLLSFSSDKELKKRFQKHCSEIGLNYNVDCSFEQMLENIRLYIVNVKIIVVLRSQEQLFLSEFAHRLRENVKPWNKRGNFKDYILENHKAKDFNLLLSMLLSKFAFEDLFIDSLNNIVGSPESTAKGLGRFMGVELSYKINKKENEGYYNYNTVILKRYNYYLNNKLKDQAFLWNLKVSNFLYYYIIKSRLVTYFVETAIKLFVSSKEIVIPKEARVNEILEGYKKGNVKIEILLKKELNLD